MDWNWKRRKSVAAADPKVSSDNAASDEERTRNHCGIFGGDISSKSGLVKGKNISDNEYYTANERDYFSSKEEEAENIRTLRQIAYDKSLLLTEAFESFDESTLKEMIPPVLQDLEIEELGKRCFEILQKLDSETVLNILEGKLPRVLDTQGNHLTGSNSVIPGKIGALHVHAAVNNDNMENSSNSPATATPLRSLETERLEMIEDECIDPHQKNDSDFKRTDEESSSDSETASSSSDSETSDSISDISSSSELNCSSTIKKDEKYSAPMDSLMELMEVQYRVRAIRSMLKSRGVSLV